jgi:hypothetical protein
MASDKSQSESQLANAAVSTFDYGVLSVEQRAIVEQKTSEIRDRLKRSAQDIWEIGQRLCEVRSQIKHGQFEAWLKAEFGWSRRTAYNFINVYESFGNRSNLAKIDIATSALYLLAAPSTPDEVRQAVIEQAKSGSKVAHKEVAQRLKQTKPAALVPEASATTSPRKTQEIVRVLKHPVELTPQTWHRLSSGLVGAMQHFLYVGGTDTPAFVDFLPPIKLAIAVTQADWDHDWLVDMAEGLVVLQPAMLNDAVVENLLRLFTEPGDVVVFPWLPQASMIGLGDRLGRQVYAGDSDLAACQAAVLRAGLQVSQDLS